MYKALLAGCGNIGAMYDWNNDHVLTHAKAFFASGLVETAYFDVNKEQSAKVAERYKGRIIEDVEKELDNTRFDIFSICTPTNFHFKLLCKALQNRIPVIICEKPVSAELKELELLAKLYADSGSKVLVNYIRRFQPAFQKLKNYIATLPETELLTNVSIRYQRGFINNCSHAFDLLQFLFQKPFAPADFIIIRKDFDHFQYDPTLSGYCEWQGANLSILGLQNVSFSHFEIDLYFKHLKVQILDAGNQILFFMSAATEPNFSPLVVDDAMTMSHSIADYMIPVAAKAISLLENQSDDNFMEALELNKTMLNILKN
jgi:predicted dehydrogenase